MVRLIFSIVFFSVILRVTLHAQQLTPLETSNYAGLHGVYLNPSAMADSRWGGMVNLGVGALTYGTPPLKTETALFHRSRLRVAGQDWGMRSQDLRGPGLMLQLRPRHALAFSTRYRTTVQFQGNENLVGWFGKAPQSFTANALAYSNHAFTEYGISYAATVLDWQQHALKVGATYKTLRGIQYASFNANGNLTATSNTLNYNLTNLQYSFSDLSFTQKFNLMDWLTGTTPGRGRSLDLGFTYEYRPQAEKYRYPWNGRQIPDPAQTKYLLRFGVALLDMGRIDYANQSFSSAINRLGSIAQNEFSTLVNSRQYQNLLWQKLDLNNVEATGGWTVTLPRTTAINLDARLNKSWFLGAVYRANKEVKSISFGPRYESQGGEFALMGHYNSLAQKLTVGAFVRFAVFVAGTDNVLGFFKNNGMPLSLFAGAFIPILPKRPKDRDGDYISNRRDQCPDVAGIWAFKGCPDTDNDGIPDKDDQCPNDAGPKTTNGCPDADGDGIFDKNDACPNEAGTTKFDGCPDSDGDGIPDKDDECPRQAGTQAQGGCPDTDGDGLKDSQDKCPNEIGIKEIEGCALAVLTQSDTANSTAENTFLLQLSNDWKAGAKANSAAWEMAQNWLVAHPSASMMVEFSGNSQDELIRLATIFKEQITGFAPNVAVKFAVKVRPNQVNSFKITLVR